MRRERETNMWFSKVWIAHLDLNKNGYGRILTFSLHCAGHLFRAGFGWQHRCLERTETNPAAADRKRKKEESGRGGGGLPCRNRKWPRPHRKWMRMKTIATPMKTAAMMRGETWIFTLILTHLYLILFAKNVCLLTEKLRKWNMPRQPSARVERRMTTTLQSFLLKK